MGLFPLGLPTRILYGFLIFLYVLHVPSIATLLGEIVTYEAPRSFCILLPLSLS